MLAVYYSYIAPKTTVAVLFPPKLADRAEVAVVAPSGFVNRMALQRGVKILRLCGYRIELLPHVFDKMGMFSGSDQARLEDLQSALDSTRFKAIVCARGGYGLTRILDKLDFTAFLKNPKWIAGYSDITPLLMATQQMGIASIHAQMLSLPEGNDGFDIQQLHRLMKTGEFDGMSAPAHPANIAGEAIGELTGGNLSLIINTIGTKYDMSFDGKILFIEEVNEYHYHIDRMMVHLNRVGKLRNLAGLVVGQFTKLKDKPSDFGVKTTEELILSHVAGYDYPVAFGMPFGHVQNNRPLVLGATVRLTVNAKESQITRVASA